MRAREIMTHPVISVKYDVGIEEASRVLVARGFTALPITDEDGHLIGIVTEADLIRDRIAPDPRIHGVNVPRARLGRPETVGDVMTMSVESFTPGADVADLAKMMVAEHIRCFPIVDGDALVGVITRRDLLRAAVMRSDSEIQQDVVRELSTMDVADRWQVTVQAGVVSIADFKDSAPDRLEADRLAESVPGVVAAQAHHLTSDPF